MIGRQRAAGWIAFGLGIGLTIAGGGPTDAALPAAASTSSDTVAAAAFDAWVADLRRVEGAAWARREWPATNPAPKPPLSAVLDDATLVARAERTLRILELLDTRWQATVDPADLQRELDRIAASTRAPAALDALFAALDRDPERLARAVALPLVAERFARTYLKTDATGHPLDVDAALAGIDRTTSVNGEPHAAPHEHPLLDLRLPIRLPEIRTDATGADAAFRAGGCVDDTWNALQVEPAPRELHTAVWTGSEMIVWGGENQNETYRTGGRYDPVTDTWTPTARDGGPLGRAGHTAVWTGSEMLIWGGYDEEFDYPDQGYRYDPASDTWSPMSTVGAPDGRDGHIAVWTGTEMIVWGGESPSVNGARYNPSTDTWASLGPQFGPDSRVEPSAVWTGTEMILVGGGYEEPSDPFEVYGDAWRYNPTTQSWTSTFFPGESRAGHSAVWTGTEMLLFGGSGVEYDPDNDEYLTVEFNDGWRYDPVTNGWTPMSNVDAPLERYGAVTAWTGDQWIVYGGYPAGNAAAYIPAIDAWSYVSTVDSPHGFWVYDATAVWTGDEMIVWGGYPDTGTTSIGGRYDPLTGNWSPTFSSNAPRPRSEAVAVWTGAEMLVHGGKGPDSLVTMRYDPTLQTWSTAASAGLTQSLYLHSAVWSGTEMIVFGGLAGSTQGGGGRYNPMSDVWTPMSTTNQPTPRYRHTAAWAGDEMFVWGGVNGNDTGGLYDPATDSWTATSLVDAPPPAYDPTSVAADGKVIVWGGSSSGNSNTGGVYDPAADVWAPTTTVGAPAGRLRHTAIWTGDEMIVWGGTTTSSAGENDGGRYDPATDSWTPTSTAGAPERRSRHTASWTGQEMVVWGGQGASLYYRTGGRYDPATDSWTPTSTDQAPSARIYQSQVWTGDEVIVFGGQILNREPIGRAYCVQTACSATDWYADGDLDGFGDANDAVSACEAPSGYVGDDSDCDDGDGDSWAVPGEVATLTLDHDGSGGTTTLAWSVPAAPGATAAGTTYDVLRADGPTGFAAGSACWDPDGGDTTAVDGETPAPGALYHYLVRARNSCPGGSGALGEDSAGAPRAGAVCP